MKIGKQLIIIIAVVVLLILVVVAVVEYQKSKSMGALAERIFSESSKTSTDTVESLKAAIAANEKQLEQYVQTASKTGTYWKLLALRLQDRGLHGEALKALERALYYNPTDAALHYYTGLSAGMMAKSFHAFPGSVNTDRNQYYDLAEESYLRSIELDPVYLRPRYGLAVLYVFELNRPEDAVPQLQQCLTISPNDIDSMFVLARAYYMLKSYQDALNLYDRIIKIVTNEQRKTEAQNNRQMVLEQMHRG